MGIQLDWQIEAEQTQQEAQEDPSSKRERRRARRRFMLLALGVACLLSSVVAALFWRLRVVENTIESNLKGAVTAEYTALRLGNRTDFMEMQRSDSDPWLASQRALFAEYQELMQQQRLDGDFEIVDVTVDEQRAHVLIEEVIDGQPYQQLWFYWNFAPSAEDERVGWRHVPKDIEFWGEEHTLENEHSTVIYNEIDAPIAEAIADPIDELWANSCGWLQCETPPENMTLRITSQTATPLAWEPPDGWQLVMLSPYLNTRVPVGDPIAESIQHSIMNALAQRLILHRSGGQLHFPPDEVIAFDSDWLKYELVDWLVAQQTGQPSPFMDSAIEVFGQDAPGKIASGILDNQQINALALAIDPNAAQLTDFGIETLDRLYWDDFFTWRLHLERERLLDDNIGDYYALYENGQSNEFAFARANDVAYRSQPAEVVQSVAFSFLADGRMVALVQAVDANNAPVQIKFVWVGDTFLRMD